jgi:PEGA domain
MKQVISVVFSACFLFASALIVPAQTTPPKQQPCVILKRMGPADEVTSHLYNFGIRGKQFQFEDGQLPDGVKFHGRLTDNDVRTIEKAGGRVEIVDSHYTDQELEDAHKRCGIATPDAKAADAKTSVTIKSIPDGADITVDGKYFGSTPSKLMLATGEHTIAVGVAGYVTWQRTITITPGNEININATLDKKPSANAQ